MYFQRKLVRGLLLLAFMLLNCRCGPENVTPQRDIAYYYPPVTGDSWETVEAASLGWDVVKLKEAVQFATDNQSTALIILYKGRIVSETYWKGWNRSTSGVIASATKSIAATRYGLIQQQGMLSINDRVSTHLGKG